MNIYKVHYYLAVTYHKKPGEDHTSKESFTGHLQVLAEDHQAAERLAGNFLKDTNVIWTYDKETELITTVRLCCKERTPSGLCASTLLTDVDNHIKGLALPEITYYIDE
jgi:hypothetical protein